MRRRGDSLGGLEKASSLLAKSLEALSEKKTPPPKVNQKSKDKGSTPSNKTPKGGTPKGTPKQNSKVRTGGAKDGRLDGRLESAN